MKNILKGNQNTEFTSGVESEQVKKYCSRLTNCLLSGVKQPVTTAKSVAKKSMMDLGIGILVTSFVLTLIVTLILSGVTFNAVNFQLATSMVLYVNVIPTVIFGAFLCIAQLIFVKKFDLKSVISICGAGQLPIIIAQICSLVGIFSIGLIVPILLCGNIGGLIVTYMALKECYGMKEDKTFFMVCFTTLASMILYLFMVQEMFSNLVDTLIESFFF